MAAALRGLRTSVVPPIRSYHVLAGRFNCANVAALRALVSACPVGLAADIITDLPDDTDLGQGIAAGIMKAPPIHASRHGISRAIRDAVPPGHVWWADLSNQHPPDFAGNTYRRLFSEERCMVAKTFYSKTKDSATLIAQLDEMRVWIGQNVPGGALSVLRCDFATEAVRQSHGDDIYTKAMSDYMDRHPGFRLLPARPIWDPTPGVALCTCLRFSACMCRCICHPTTPT